MLTRMPLRLSLPLLLSVFAGLFTLLLTTFQLPSSIEAAVEDWQNRTRQHFALLQSSLSDHVRHGRTAELETELADLASLDGIAWAMVIDRDLRIVASTRLDLRTDQLNAISPSALKARVRMGHASWLPLAGQRQLAIYPLDRTGQIPRPASMTHCSSNSTSPPSCSRSSGMPGAIWHRSLHCCFSSGWR